MTSRNSLEWKNSLRCVTGPANRRSATVISTSTRNFPNRLGKNTNVYLASVELAAIASRLGRIPNALSRDSEDWNPVEDMDAAPAGFVLSLMPSDHRLE